MFEDEGECPLVPAEDGPTLVRDLGIRHDVPPEHPVKVDQERVDRRSSARRRKSRTSQGEVATTGKHERFQLPSPTSSRFPRFERRRPSSGA
jgi:hypothetical protein